MSEQVLDRLDAVERQLHTLKREVESIRASVIFARPSEPAASPRPRPSAPPPVTPQPAPTPPPRIARDAPPQRPGRELDLSALLSARALAWAGGAVTALGIVFLFALAVNRGWIGPEARVLLGALASLTAFGGGLELRRRFGDAHSATGAVAAGVAGSYATLLAAVGLYDLVPEPIGLVLAGVTAAASVAVALSWVAEGIAGLGLVGAMAMPVLLLGDTGGPTRLGTAFTSIALAACATLGVARAWRRQLAVAAVFAAGEALGLFLWDDLSPSLLILAGAVWAVYLTTGIAWQLVHGGSRVGATASTFVVGSVGFAWASVAALFQDESHAHRGFALLACAGVYAVLAAVLFRARRDLGVLLGVLALTVTAIAAADIFSNAALTYTWAAEAAGLAVAARLLRERRFQLVALGYVALATMHALTTEAELDRLFRPFEHPATGVPSLVALAVSAIVVAYAARFDDGGAVDEGVFRFVQPATRALREHPGRVRGSLLVLAGLLLADAVGRTTLAAAQQVWTGVEHAFANGHVAVTGLWAAAALALTLVGLLLRRRPALYAGLIWIEIVAFKALGFDTRLDRHVWPWSFALVGVATLAIAAAVERDATVPAVGPLYLVAAFGLGVASAAGLLDGRAEGAAFLGLALLAAGVAAVFFDARHRAFATTAWSTALSIAAVGEALVLDGQAATIAWAATAAALPWLAHATGERRFQLGAIAYLVLSLGDALGEHAPPGDFVHAAVHPGAGVPALVAVALALSSFAAAAIPVRGEARDELDRELDRAQPTWRAAGWWLAGAVGLYGASLAILEVAVRLGPDGVTAAFQGGHTAVTALWGTLGLVLLYLGLRRNVSGLRIAGFALFGVSLGKLFLYDLARLSSITRAASFLAVGAVLLIGGFLYQHLGERRVKEIAGNGI